MYIEREMCTERERDMIKHNVYTYIYIYTYIHTYTKGTEVQDS